MYRVGGGHWWWGWVSELTKTTQPICTTAETQMPTALRSYTFLVLRKSSASLLMLQIYWCNRQYFIYTSYMSRKQCLHGLDCAKYDWPLLQLTKFNILIPTGYQLYSHLLALLHRSLQKKKDSECVSLAENKVGVVGMRWSFSMLISEGRPTGTSPGDSIMTGLKTWNKENLEQQHPCSCKCQ